uniref:Uncharacterized protein n=1 Tax=Avena sativa TaxID=4498 RepID=A0ACD5XQG5_AVESA
MDHPENIVADLIQEEHRSKWIARSNHNVKCFTEDEIKRFTNNYETLLGKGAFGEVYEGVLEDKSMVAVKRFISNVKENFAKELTVHREINHKNVVRLVGYCVDENALMVVTEYIPKGNLSNILHQDISIPIPLDARLRIAIECAEALGYMHSQMYTQVIHGDIKPANILLDDGFRAKISDFGISRLVNTENTLYTLNVIGSIGYMDPLFAQNGRFTAKSDVYSFGVVLLELITRKKARTEGGELGLVGSFTKALSKGFRSVREMFDPEIATLSDMKSVEEIAKLAGKCLRMEVDKRPEMLQVAECLRKLRKAPHQLQERLPLFSWRRKNKLATAQRPPGGGQNVRTVAPAATTTSEESSSGTPKRGTFIAGLKMTCPLFTLDNLLRGSAEILGKGTVGTTYKVKLESGNMLVVKRQKLIELPEEEFALRVTVIGAIHNKHIAPLLWYLWRKDEKLLVYNFFPMGSLAQALHGDRVSGQAPLVWEQRAAISLAAARGVASIHSAGPSSFHGNIKSSNIMLTGTHGACVSEHGLTTLGLFRGLSGYSAPEITDSNWVSQEADVYSFGVVLLELVTRKAPVNDTQLEDGVDLPQWVCSLAREEWAAKVIDAELVALAGQHKDRVEECMVRFLELAIHCYSKDAKLRPTMSDVVQRIEKMPT